MAGMVGLENQDIKYVINLKLSDRNSTEKPYF